MRAATQYDETHEWIECQGRHGVAVQTPRFGLTMNALRTASWASITMAPVEKARRKTRGTSWRCVASAGPAAQP